MPTFRYTGRSAGQAIHGELDAADVYAVAQQLQSRGIAPLTIEAHAASTWHALRAGMSAPTPAAATTPATAVTATAAAAAADGRPAWLQPDWLQASWWQPRISPQDLMLFARQLHMLLRSGVPILRALAGLQDSSSHARFAAVLADLRRGLESGRELSLCLAQPQQQQVFDGFFVAMVRVGEMTGRLDEVLKRLAEHIDFEIFMRQQVKAALRYPMFVCAAMAVAIGVINVMVIPAFAQVFTSMKADLPWATRLLLATSQFTVSYGWLMALCAGGAWLGWHRWKHTPHGQLRWHQLLLRAPLAGKIVHKAMLARFARSMSLALRSGLPIEQTLTVTAQTVDNAYMARKVDEMREAVERGETILRAASASGVFTPVVLQMIAVGEETGSVDELMDEIAQLYNAEVQYELKTLSQQIEPILIVLLGAMVLVLALGVFLPMWDLGQATLK